MPFKSLLKDLTTRVGGSGAVILDREGELVDSYSLSPELEIDLIGAHQSVILSLVEEVTARNRGFGRVDSIGISAGSKKLAISTIKDGYHLVVVMECTGSIGRAIFESRRFIERIVDEF